MIGLGDKGTLRGIGILELTDKYTYPLAQPAWLKQLPDQPAAQIAVGKGMDAVALSAEVSPMFTGVNRHVDPEFGIGIDIETGGHIFQLRLSNTTWISEDRMYTRTWAYSITGFQPISHLQDLIF